MNLILEYNVYLNLFRRLKPSLVFGFVFSVFQNTCYESGLHIYIVEPLSLAHSSLVFGGISFEPSLNIISFIGGKTEGV